MAKGKVKNRSRVMSPQNVLLPIMVVLLAIPAAPIHTDQVASKEVLSSTELPVLLERIRRKLDRLPSSQEERNLLRLNYYIDVYGSPPELDLLEGFDIHYGPVPYLSTHSELLQVTTPRHFQSAVVNIIGWTWK